MRLLIVLGQSDPPSFSAEVAQAYRAGAEAAGHTVDVIDLVGEGFDPREGQADLDCYHGRARSPMM